MIKMTLVELAVFSIPFVLFFAYRKFLLRHQLQEGETFSPVPYHKLFIAGGILSIVVFFILAFGNEKITDKTYVPARMENGKLIPSEFVDPKDK